MSDIIDRQIVQGDGSTYNEINHIIINSVDYKHLLEEIEELKEDVEDARTDEKRLRKSKKLNEKQEQLETLKQNVKKLYETFTKIPINTERLRLAKEHFDKGEFREADTILQVEKMNLDLTKLKEREKTLNEEKAEIEQRREQISNEYFVKAQLWKNFYNEPNWFKKANEYFDKALDAARTAKALFAYSLFLLEHNQFQKAFPFCEEVLVFYKKLAETDPQTYK